MATAASLSAFIIWQCVTLFGFGLAFMSIQSVPMKALNAKCTGSATGMINFGGQLAGVIAPVIMGALIDRFTYVAAFVFLALGALLGLVAAIVAPQTPEALVRKLARNQLLASGFAVEVAHAGAER